MQKRQSTWLKPIFKRGQSVTNVCIRMILPAPDVLISDSVCRSQFLRLPLDLVRCGMIDFQHDPLPALLTRVSVNPFLKGDVSVRILMPSCDGGINDPFSLLR